MAGVVALIGYIERFTSGEFSVEGVSSSSEQWPFEEGEETYGENGFPYDVLSNVKEALGSIAGTAPERAQPSADQSVLKFERGVAR